MSDGIPNSDRQVGYRRSVGTNAPDLHSAWLQFIRYCGELGHGEIEKLKIQNGLPMIAELAVKKVKFAP